MILCKMNVEEKYNVCIKKKYKKSKEYLRLKAM